MWLLVVLTDVSVEIPRCQDAKANVEGMLPLHK